MEEAEYFAEQRLADGEFAVDALVVNRVHASTPASSAGRAARHARSSSARSPATPRRGSRLRYENLAEFEDVAGRERRELSGLEERIGDASVAHVPELGHDVHDFAALRAVADHLLAAG